MVLRANILCIRLLVVGIAICSNILVYGQEKIEDVPIASSGDIQFYIDHASFRGLDHETIVEFYFMIYADQLKYRFEDNRETANIQTEITIEDSDGIEINNTLWIISPYLSEENMESQYQVFYDQWDYSLKPGTYNILIMITDLSSSSTGRAHFTLDVPEICQCSQLQFVSEYGVGDSTHPFYKASKIVYPCPSRRYGVINQILFIYYELYGLKIELADSLYIRYFVVDHNGNIAKEYPQKRILARDSDIGISHGMRIADLESGNYRLVADIEGGTRSQRIRISRVFEVIQKDYLTKNSQFAEDQINVQNDLMQILATSRQYKYFSNLSVNAKLQYLIDFWRDRDPIPNTPENEYLIELLKRYEFANKNYSWGMIEGWNTDRGQILIKYGYPDEVNQYDYEEALNPYEIWQFHDIRNYIFIFGDVHGDGRYRLLHSNAEGEIHDFNWERLLIKTL